MGLHRVGFEVTGIDIDPQPEYPFPFIQADALDAPVKLQNYDLIWASPPCQAYTWGTRTGRQDKFPTLVEATRAMLKESGKAYIIENVPGAPLEKPVCLCGAMFRLRVLRHRIFESNLRLQVPPHPKHQRTQGHLGRKKPRSYYACVAGAGGNGYSYRLEDWQKAMGIDWLSKPTLIEAIPPAYSEYLGRQAVVQILGTRSF